MESTLNVEVSNLPIPILEVEVSPFINYVSDQFVYNAISSHNISNDSHLDIRLNLNNLTNSLSGYAEISGANFTGNITASNLSGVNTGDQDLSNLATYTSVSDSLSSHNISNDSHLDIRSTINNLNNSLSGYVIKITSTELSAFLLNPDTDGIFDIIIKHNNLINRLLGD